VITRVPVTEAGLRAIAENLRERDRRELFALRWSEDLDVFVQGQLAWMGDMCCIWELNGVPVSCQGVFALWPGVWSVFAYGTDQWRHVVLDMTRHAYRFIIPALLGVKFHRAECRAMASHTDSRRWIEFLGARQECVLRGYGKQGEDFVLYVWRPEDVVRPIRSRTKQRMLAVDREREDLERSTASSSAKHLVERQNDQSPCGTFGMGGRQRTNTARIASAASV
jgi:hypothetical protein